MGGPCSDHIKLYGLDEHSHPMDWFSSIVPMTPNKNLHDASVPNVRGNFKTKFAFANWVAYSNMKAMMVNAGAGGAHLRRQA